MATARTPEEVRPVESCLAELLDHLGIASAHFAGRGSADLRGFASTHPERIASLTLLCPAVLDTRTLAPVAGRLLVVTGDHGPGARRVRAGLFDLPEATAVVLDDYAGPTWADIAAERRYRTDNSVIGSFRSLWFVTQYGGRWVSGGTVELRRSSS
jgi:pimeloyl-ACP methyl ester carboxylesterase